MTSPTGRDLGVAQGRIIIDASSLREASTIAQQVAKEINTALASISGGALGNLAKLSQAWAQQAQQNYQSVAQAARTSAKDQMDADAARLKSLATTTQAEIQLIQDRIDALNKLKAAQAPASGSGGSGGAGGSGSTGGGVGQAYRFPTFIQFAAYPAGQLLSSFGATGAASAVMTGGALAGLIDQLPLLGFQIQTLAGRITGLGGVVGTLARLGAGAELALAGTATGLGAVLAVAAPLVVVLVGVAAVMGEIQRQAEIVNQVLREQADLNKQIAGGATSADLQEQRDRTERERAAAQQTLEQFQSIRDRFQTYQSSPESVSDMGAILSGSPVSQTLASLRQAMSDITGGATSSLNDVYSLIDGQTKIVDEYAVSIGLLNANMQNGNTTANDIAALNNQLAESWVDVANTERDLARLNVEQLQARQAAGQQEIADINMVYAQTSGKQKDIFDERLAQLDVEANLIRQLLPAARQAELTDFITKAQAAYDAFQLQGGRTAEDRQIAAGDTALDRGIQAQRRLQDAQIQRAQTNEDFERSQLRSQEDYLDTRAKQERDYAQDALERQQDLQDKLTQIISDSRIKILEAAARLDARGVFEEQRRRDQQLADTRDTASKEQNQREQAFRQQLEDQRVQFEKQRQRAESDFALRIQREDAQRQLQAQRQIQDDALQDARQERNNALQDQRRREDFARQIQSLVGHYVSMANIQNAYQSIMQQSWGAFLGNMVAQVNPMNLRGGHGGGGTGGNFLNASTGIGSAINATALGYNYSAGQFPSSFSGVPFFDNGGINLRPGLFYAGVPEAHIPLPKSGSSGSAAIVHIDNLVLGDIGDRSDAQVMQLIDRGFRTFFERGVARG